MSRVLSSAVGFPTTVRVGVGEPFHYEVRGLCTQVEYRPQLVSLERFDSTFPDYQVLDNIIHLELRQVQDVNPREIQAEVERRFQWLESLSPGERAFVTALCNNPGAKPVRAIFADWLEEHDRLEEASRLRQLAGGS